MNQFGQITKESFNKLREERLAAQTEVTKDLISKVTADDEHKFACYVEIDYGDIPGIGRFCGKIPMFSHDPKPSREHLPEAEVILRNVAIEAKMLIPKERLEGPDNIIRTSLTCALYSHPNEDPRSQFIVVPAACILAVYYADDEMCGDLTVNTVNETNDLFLSNSDLLVDIMQGKYETFEDVPQVAATVEPVFRLFWLLYKRYGHLVTPDAEKAKYLREEYTFGFKCATAMRVANVGHKCSGELFRVMRGGDSGSLVLTELIAIGICNLENDGLISLEVRDHVLFKILKRLICQDAGLANDLLGFIREMNGNEIYYNYVLRNVEVGGMTYAESFNHTCEVVTNLRKDIAILFEQLVEEFPEDQSLLEFIVLIKQMLDANVYVPSCTPRYGGMKMTEIPIGSK